MVEVRHQATPISHTSDGKRFDLQTVGEYVMARSEAADIEVQARFAARGTRVSVVAHGGDQNGGTRNRL